jgi:short-subunit dehydrogenase
MSAPRSGQPFHRALITGAAGGLGSELSRLLAADGTGLVLLDRDQAGLQRLRDALAGTVDVQTRTVDIRQYEVLETALRDLTAEQDTIDLVVANAGIDHPAPIQADGWRNLNDHLATNVAANFVVCSVMLPRLIEQGGGHVVAIASLGGLGGFPYEAGYCASKAALAVFIESVRAEVAPRGVTFTTVFPGFIDTPMLRGNAFAVTSALAPARAAAKIYRAMRKRRPTLYFPLSTYLLLCLAKLLPVPVRDHLARAQMKRGFATQPAPRSE